MWQYMAGAGAGAGAEIRELELELKMNNLSSATLCGTIEGEGFKTLAGINVESVFLG